MQYNISVQEAGLNGGREVWVRVLSNEVLDFPRVEKEMSAQDRSTLNSINPRKLLNYFPHLVTPEEKVDHGFSFEDWWCWGSAAPRRTDA